MKAKQTYAVVVGKGAKGMMGGIIVFIACFAIWGFACFGGACIDFAKKLL